jgi:hypothetical protein
MKEEIYNVRTASWLQDVPARKPPSFEAIAAARYGTQSNSFLSPFNQHCTYKTYSYFIPLQLTRKERLLNRCAREGNRLL